MDDHLVADISPRQAHVAHSAPPLSEETIMTNPEEAKGSRREHLTETTKDGKIELTEDELKRVSGGVKIAYTPSPLDIKSGR
jgi:bacteriocin-like protein